MFIQQLFGILAVPPGNLVYHLVLAFSIAGALQSALSQWIDRDFLPGKRMVIGLGLLFFIQLVHFGLGGLAWQGFLTGQALFPIFDRAITFISLIWIVWLWVFPEPVKLADAAAVLLSLAALVFLAVNLALGLAADPAQTFNGSWLDFAWELFAALVVLSGASLCLIRRPVAWGTGFTMLLMVLCGYILQLAGLAPAADYPGLVRLSLLASFPMLLSLPQRTVKSADPHPQPAAPEPVKPHPITHERRRYSTDNKTFRSFWALLTEDDSQNLCTDITRLIAQTMVADLCFLTSTPDSSRQVTFQGGYDLIREEKLDGFTIDADRIPLLAGALEKGRPLRLSTENASSSDLNYLANTLSLANCGNMMEVPVIAPQHGPIGSVVLFSPYSNRVWSSDDLNYITPVSDALGRFLSKAAQPEPTQAELDQYRAQIRSMSDRVKAIEQEKQDLLTRLDNAASLEYKVDPQPDLNSWNNALAVQDEYQQTITRLQSENKTLQQALDEMLSGAANPPAGDRQHMEKELQQTLKEVAYLQNRLAETNIRILELERLVDDGETIADELRHIIAALAQDLRQPMASIAGYTDLLLGGTTGSLNPLQFKFIERIKASTERMHSLLDDLIQMITLDAKQLNLKKEAVDLNGAMDDAMAFTSAQIREKNIGVQVDIPEAVPQVCADPDALQQVIIHLLENAGQATPENGTIILRVQTQYDSPEEGYALLQVTDTGGGIPVDDIPRVFSRMYRADRPLIQGLGDTGVGLSLAKTLIEAMEGRIWVDTVPGKTSTFNVLLPIDPVSMQKEQANH